MDDQDKKPPFLPDDLPVFPLSGVLLLPRGQLPLNIFEPRYIAMVDESLRAHRMIGMIQPVHPGGSDLFRIGCAGRIVDFRETDDGRYEITLRGVSRFHVVHEHAMTVGGYRHVRAGWSAFSCDLDPVGELNIDRAKLCGLLRAYFDMEGMDCNWAAVDNASDDRLMTCLSMICPLDAGEKQALLEASCGKARADLFMTMLEIATRDTARQRPEQPCRH